MSHELIKAAIDEQQEMRETFLSLISFDLRTVNVHFYRELHIVSVNLGRQSGHSSFIQKYAKTGDVIIIRYNVNLNYFKSKCVNDPVVFTYANIQNQRGKDDLGKAKTIWIDDFSCYDGIDWNVINGYISLQRRIDELHIVRLG